MSWLFFIKFVKSLIHFQNQAVPTCESNNPHRIPYFTNSKFRICLDLVVNTDYWLIYVVGMSIEKLFDMWRNDEFSRNLFQCFFLKYKTETAKTVQRQLHILHNISTFRHFVTSFLLTCQPHKKKKSFSGPLLPLNFTSFSDFKINCR